MIIGLTGGSGVGKTTASRVIESFGFVAIDFDRVSREVCSPGTACLLEICSVFGEDILNPDESLNRKKLGEIVFANKEKLEILTKITHKHILERTDEIIEENKNKNLLFDAPLLFEAGLDKKCDFVISVLSETQKRLERICQRDSISLQNAQNRIASQPDDNFYISKSDFCVYNNSSEKELESEITKILRRKFNEA